jgi:hypothetical protein
LLFQPQNSAKEVIFQDRQTFTSFLSLCTFALGCDFSLCSFCSLAAISFAVRHQKVPVILLLVRQHPTDELKSLASALVLSSQLFQDAPFFMP